MKKNNPSYIGERNDIVELVPASAIKILDVGCSEGMLGEKLKKKNNAEVTGIEIDKNMAEVAKQKLDRVIIDNIDEIDLKKHLRFNYFDCIIFADILEHLQNPWKIIGNVKPFLKDNGVVIISVPNIRHYTTIYNLLARGVWPYNDRGIHDKNHLRYFTFKTIKKIFQDAEYEIVGIKRNYRIIERPHSLNKFARIFSFFPFMNFVTFQYLITFKKIK